MTTVEIYEKETGDKSPNNQIFHHDWRLRYVQWMEKRVGECSDNQRDLLTAFIKEVQEEFKEINLEYLSFAADRFLNKLNE